MTERLAIEPRTNAGGGRGRSRERIKSVAGQLVRIESREGTVWAEQDDPDPGLLDRLLDKDGSPRQSGIL